MPVLTFYFCNLHLQAPFLHLFHVTHGATLLLDHIQLASEPFIFEPQGLIPFILLLIFESEQLHLAAHLCLSSRHHFITDVILTFSPVNLAMRNSLKVT